MRLCLGRVVVSLLLLGSLLSLLVGGTVYQRLADGGAAADVDLKVHTTGAAHDGGKHAGNLVVAGHRAAAVQAQALKHLLVTTTL